MFYLHVNELIYLAIFQHRYARYTYLPANYLICHIISQQIRALYTICR